MVWAAKPEGLQGYRNNGTRGKMKEKNRIQGIQ